MLRLLDSGPYQLLVAASTGDHSALAQLINEEGISPSHEFPRGITALHEACERGHVEATQLLVDLGADVNKQVSQDGEEHAWSSSTPVEASLVTLPSLPE